MRKYKKICEICNQEFISNAHNASVCNSCKVTKCVICGKEFKRDWPYNQKVCSSECYGIYRQKMEFSSNLKECSIERVCEICGKSFIAKSSRRKICYDDHFHRCPVCGTTVKTTSKYDSNKCCSMKCIIELRKRTEREHFGMIDPRRTDSANARRVITNLEKYGSENPFGSSAIKNKIRSVMLEKYGVVNPQQSEEIRKKTYSTNLERYGVEHPAQSERVQEKIQSIFKKRYGNSCYFHTDDYRSKARNTLMRNYGVDNPMRSKELHTKQVSNIHHIFASDGTQLDSNYELIVYEKLKSFGLNVGRDIPTEYVYDGKHHTTYIDFRMDDMLIEAKGFHLLQGCFDYAPSMVPIERKLEVYRQNDVVVVTDSQGAKILRSHHVRGIDIEVFKDNSWNWGELKSLLSVEGIFISSEVLS